MKKTYKDDERSGAGRNSGDERSTNDGHDQDSSLSFESDTESESNHVKGRRRRPDDYVKRSTREAAEKMRTFKVASWAENKEKTEMAPSH